MISFIVPVQYMDNDYIYKRTIELIELFNKLNDKSIELVIVDTSKKKLLHNVNTTNIILIEEKYHQDIYSPAKSRNIGSKYATKEYLFFFDVDLLFSEIFIEKLKSEVLKKIKNKNDFIMIPCFYLSQLGTTLFNKSSKKQETINVFRESFLYGDNQYVSRLAVNTSSIILRKNYFEDLGMFCEEFKGHGGEDFELLHRLAANNPHAKRCQDYYTDKVEDFIVNYKGFRKYLSYYSLHYLFSDLLLVHRWHPRPLTKKFYFRRSVNENILIKKMKNYDAVNDNIWLNSKEPLDFTTYLTNLLKENAYDPSQAIGFFKLQNGLKHKKPISAKIRKLLTKPKMFFKDMIKKRVT